MTHKTIIRFKHELKKEFEKIAEDFVKTAEKSGEKLNYSINNNILEINGCKNRKHACRIMYWFKKKFPSKLVYAITQEEKNELST